MIRILLAEDEEAMRMYLARALTTAGYEVVAVDRGTAAIPYLEQEHFDLLLSDIVMPGGMSGVDLAGHARSLNPDLPILLTTGYAGDRIGEGADELDWPVLRKPFRAEQLASMVREALAEPA